MENQARDEIASIHAAYVKQIGKLEFILTGIGAIAENCDDEIKTEGLLQGCQCTLSDVIDGFLQITDNLDVASRTLKA